MQASLTPQIEMLDRKIVVHPQRHLLGHIQGRLQLRPSIGTRDPADLSTDPHFIPTYTILQDCACD